MGKFDALSADKKEQFAELEAASKELRFESLSDAEEWSDNLVSVLGTVALADLFYKWRYCRIEPLKDSEVVERIDPKLFRQFLKETNWKFDDDASYRVFNLMLRTGDEGTKLLLGILGPYWLGFEVDVLCVTPQEPLGDIDVYDIVAANSFNVLGMRYRTIDDGATKEMIIAPFGRVPFLLAQRTLGTSD